jgi:hypothetical protein
MAALVFLWRGVGSVKAMSKGAAMGVVIRFPSERAGTPARYAYPWLVPAMFWLDYFYPTLPATTSDINERKDRKWQK